MPALMPAQLREELRLTIRLYDDGSALLALEVGPCEASTDFRHASLSAAPWGLQSASEIACALVGIWADAGVLGLATEAPG